MPEHAETTATGARPRARERGRMRRRLREQRRMREALLLDLGALVYELQRHGRREPELLQAKAAELSAVDQEVRALADALDAGDGMLALVAAGIAGSCESCGSLLSTDARYCQACGAVAVPALRGGGDARRLDRSPRRADRQLAEPEPAATEPDGSGEIGPDEPGEQRAGGRLGRLRRRVRQPTPAAPWLASDDESDPGNPRDS